AVRGAGAALELDPPLTENRSTRTGAPPSTRGRRPGFFSARGLCYSEVALSLAEWQLEPPHESLARAAAGRVDPASSRSCRTARSGPVEVRRDLPQERGSPARAHRRADPRPCPPQMRQPTAWLAYRR